MEQPERFTDEEIDDFVEFLQQTLIPDLMDSGTEETAKDFVTATAIIQQLQGKS